MAINSSTRSLGLDNAEGIVTSKNYVKSTFETGNTAGWSLFNTTLTNSLPSGAITAGATSLALSATTTNPIEGTTSLQLVAAGIATAGHGIISDIFTASNADLGKVLNSKFSYNVVSGATNLNFSGILGSQSISVAFYDVTAATWIAAPAGALGMLQSSGYTDTGPITFQTSVTVGQQYRMALYFSVASAGAATLTFDNFVCSKGVITTGAAMTDWVSYTPTVAGLGTGSSTNNARYRRVGDSIEVEYRLVKDASTGSGALTVSASLPPGLSIDYNKLPVNSTQSNAIGYFSTGGFTTAVNGGVLDNSATSVYFLKSTATVLTGADFTANAAILAVFTAPIVGFSSNVQQSSDSDQRTTSFSGSTTGSISNAALTAFNGAWAVGSDDTGSFSGSTFTARSSGFYPISATVTANTSAGGGNVSVTLYKNGAISVAGMVTGNYSSAVANNYSGTVILKLNAGDTITFFGQQSTFGGSFAVPLAVYIFKLSGSAVVQATESVNAKYNTILGRTLTTAGPLVLFENKIYDSHSAYSSGVYTVPISGRYRISAYLRTTSTAFGANQYVGFILRKAGALVSGSSLESPGICGVRTNAAGTYLLECSGSNSFYFLAGEQVAIGGYSDVTTSTFTDGYTYFSIERVGN